MNIETFSHSWTFLICTFSVIWNNPRCGLRGVQGRLNFLTSEQLHDPTHVLYFVIFYLKDTYISVSQVEFCEFKIIANKDKICQQMYVDAHFDSPCCQGHIFWSVSAFLNQHPLKKNRVWMPQYFILLFSYINEKRFYIAFSKWAPIYNVKLFLSLSELIIMNCKHCIYKK